MNKKTLEDLIHLMKKENLKILSYESGEEKVHLEAFSPDIHDHNEKDKKPKEKPHNKQKETPPAPKGDEGDLVDIKIDQIGVFYTQPSADSPETYVKVGDHVTPEDTIGLIETMKVFTEVKPDKAGVIEEILVSNGEQVDFGQVVMRIRPEEA